MKTTRTEYNAAAVRLLDHIEGLTAAVKQHAGREMRSQGGYGWVADVEHVDTEVRELIAFLNGDVK
jgi:hypothetical protein